jgi:hypothetical protein
MGSCDGPSVGFVVGRIDGWSEGAIDGATDGATFGNRDGPSVGNVDGREDGWSEGGSEGATDGAVFGNIDGPSVGTVEGPADGLSDVSDVGESDGGIDGVSMTTNGANGAIGAGTATGSTVGTNEGIDDGNSEGCSERMLVGTSEGSREGAPEGASVMSIMSVQVPQFKSNRTAGYRTHVCRHGSSSVAFRYMYQPSEKSKQPSGTNLHFPASNAGNRLNKLPKPDPLNKLPHSPVPCAPTNCTEVGNEMMYIHKKHEEYFIFSSHNVVRSVNPS